MSELDNSNFKVMYTADAAKKRKVYHDGVLNLRKQKIGDFCLVTLLNEDGKELRRSNEKYWDKYEVGAEITFGIYSFTIDSVLESDIDCTIVSSNPVTESKSKFAMPPMKYRKVSKVGPDAYDNETNELVRTSDIVKGPSLGKFKVPSSTNSTSADNENPISKTQADFSSAITLDPTLSKRMRSHQIEAANFILARFNADKDDNKENFTKEYRGAILADEVAIFPPHT
jgi:hypothetical protein